MYCVEFCTNSGKGAANIKQKLCHLKMLESFCYFLWKSYKKVRKQNHKWVKL